MQTDSNNHRKRLDLKACAIEVETHNGHTLAYVMHGCDCGDVCIAGSEIPTVISFLSQAIKKPTRPTSNKRAPTNPAIHQPSDRLMRIDEVIQITGLGKTSIYALGNRGEFPPRLKISSRAVAWSKNAVDKWLAGFGGVAA